MVTYKEIDWENLELEKYGVKDLLEIKRLSYFRYDSPITARLLIILCMISILFSAMICTIRSNILSLDYTHPAFYILLTFLFLGGLLFLPLCINLHSESMKKWGKMNLIRKKVEEEIGRRDSLYFSHTKLESLFK